MARQIISMLNIELSPEQEEVFYTAARIIVVGGGEGAGKTYLAALYALCRAIYDAKQAASEGKNEALQIWLIGADFEDARKVFDYIVGFLDQLHALDRKSSSISTHKDIRCLAVTRASETGVPIIFETVSGYDPLKIGREQPDGFVGEEVSRWDKEVFDRVYDRQLRKFPRSWSWLSGSFETSIGWFAETFLQGQGPNEMDVVSKRLPSWANRTIYKHGYDDPALERARAHNTEARFMERFGGLPTPPKNAVFPQFKALLHVTEIAQFRPDLPVYLAVDPGNKVYAVEFVQYVDDHIHVVDEVYVSQYSHEQVVQAAMLKPAWQSLSSTALHTIDIAGSYHTPEGLGTAVQAWKESTGVDFSYQRYRVEDEVERLYSALAINPADNRPYLQVHPNAKGLIAEMGGGPNPVEGVGMWTMKNGRPHASNNHACQALAYQLLRRYGASNPSAYRTAPKGLTYLQPTPANRKRSSQSSYVKWNT